MAPMDRQQVVTRLIQLGLEKDEAEAYVQLFIMGPCRAGDIAEAMNVHQTKGYWAMNHLVKKGFARALPSTPTRYEAISPQEIAEQTVAEKEKRLREIGRLWNDVADPLEQLRDANRDAVPADTYRLVHGRKEVVKIALDAFDRMEDELLVYSANPWSHLAPESYKPVWERGVARAREGVETHAILNTTDEMREFVEPLVEIPDLHIRHVEPDMRNAFVVVDAREIIYWLVTDPETDPKAEREVAVWSNAEELVEEQHELFKTLWDNARTLAEVPAKGDRAGTVEPGP